MTVTRDGLHDLVNRLPVEELEHAAEVLQPIATARDRAREVADRLASAGLLAVDDPLDIEPVDEERFQAARREAGTGRPLAEYVSDERG